MVSETDKTKKAKSLKAKETTKAPKAKAEKQNKVIRGGGILESIKKFIQKKQENARKAREAREKILTAKIAVTKAAIRT